MRSRTRHRRYPDRGRRGTGGLSGGDQRCFPRSHRPDLHRASDQKQHELCVVEGPQADRPGRSIYRAETPDAGLAALEAFEEGHWDRKHPAIAQSWRRHWDQVIPFFAFPDGVRRIIYITNAIEALNSKIRRAVRTRGHFLGDDAAMKLLYLVLNHAAANGNARRANGGGQKPVRRHLRRKVRHLTKTTGLAHKISDSPYWRQPYLRHQPPCPPSPDFMARRVQVPHHLAATVPWALHEHPVDHRHQSCRDHRRVNAVLAANSANFRSPRTASSATFALNSPVYRFRVVFIVRPSLTAGIA